jgi:molybdate transport system substrate-binding protein
MPRHAKRAPLLVMLAAVLLTAGSADASAREALNVLYAGSLVNLMEQGIGPAFDAASADRMQGFAGGSKQLAREITGKLRAADVFVSANPRVNDRLMGPANGAWVSWYVSFAQSPLVIGYDRSSRFAADFKTQPWYRVLLEPGIRIGRTDPQLDPKGALTLELMRRAAVLYKMPDLARRVLGKPDNPAQVLPEESLIGRLQTGLIDVGFFYSTETTAAGIPAVDLPDAITPKAVYTITIVRGAPHPRAAERFVEFMLGAAGRRVLEQYGLDVRKPALSGDAAAAPSRIRSVLEAAR